MRKSWHGFCDIPHAPVVASDQGRRLVIGTGASRVHCGGAPGPVVGGLPAPFYLRRTILQRKSPALPGFLLSADARQGRNRGDPDFPTGRRHRERVIPITSVSDVTGQLRTACDVHAPNAIDQGSSLRIRPRFSERGGGAERSGGRDLSIIRGGEGSDIRRG